MRKCMTKWVGKDILIEDTMFCCKFYRQSIEQYYIESSCSDLNNSVAVGNVSGDTKTENQWLKTCTMYASTHGPSTSTSTSTLLPSTGTGTSTKYCNSASNIKIIT